MDALEHNIGSICPLAFSGTSGGLFAGAIAAVVAAHCAIIDDYQWPKDNAEEILGRSGGVSYDFIVVGAGTAGSLLASHLTNHFPSMSILLIEAGDVPGLNSEVPAFLFLNQITDIDWNYKTNPDGKSCLGFKNDSCTWNKGKVMGGSSSINAMLYIRGHPNDFDSWKSSENPSWSYEDLSYYFKQLEEDLKLTYYKYPENPWYNLFNEAWRELGFIFHNGSSDEAVVGTRKTRLLTQNGKRLNTGKLYLNASKNLYVMRNTTVQKVLIDPKSKIVTGVEIRYVNGVVMQISVTKEVILSAGSIATPQILMLSGIGPKTHLNDKRIECLENLPVGQNLQDHLLLPLFLQTDTNTTFTFEKFTSYLLQYMLTKTGPLTNIGITDYMGFINTKDVTDFPDIQLHHTYFSKEDRVSLRPYLEGLGYKDEIINAICELNERHELLGIYPSLLHPKSRGEILLTDSDIKSKPIIKANYFYDSYDLETLLKAIEFVHELENTIAFKSLNIKLVRLKMSNCSDFLFDTNNYWECYIRHMATTLYHPVGTAKMGLRKDNSVVNHNLLVHGIQKLRVVDASIMPAIPGANTMASTLVIAKKAVDIIKSSHRTKDEF